MGYTKWTQRYFERFLGFVLPKNALSALLLLFGGLVFFLLQFFFAYILWFLILRIFPWWNLYVCGCLSLQLYVFLVLLFSLLFSVCLFCPTLMCFYFIFWCLFSKARGEAGKRVWILGGWEGRVDLGGVGGGVTDQNIVQKTSFTEKVKNMC